MKNICVVIGSRANYSSIKSSMEAIDKHPGLNPENSSYSFFFAR